MAKLRPRSGRDAGGSIAVTSCVGLPAGLAQLLIDQKARIGLVEIEIPSAKANAACHMKVLGTWGSTFVRHGAILRLVRQFLEDPLVLLPPSATRSSASRRLSAGPRASSLSAALRRRSVDRLG